ncbi:hypothetical protein [Sporosarcina sp. ZBG7A]|uniref:hypothetical protein n=1 Tax=Sporosarcina sp. ZBG7A TaxID=1582223 RepID=UPI00057A3A9D|nr:hypothetical protein [Sporosarcina sp. ZBG7A]
MKYMFVQYTLIGIFLFGCSTKEEQESKMQTVNNSPVATTEIIEITHPHEIDIFRTAIKDSTQVPGIVNMTKPHYNFRLGEESYSLWLTEDNGTILNQKDRNTIYTLSSVSLEKLYGFIHEN